MQRHARNKYRKKNGPTLFGMLGMGAASMFRNKRLKKQHDKLHEGDNNKENNNETNQEEEKPRVVMPKVPVSKKDE